MYVCICKAVSQSRIRKAVGEGACSLRDLRNGLGVGTGCGRCLEEAQAVLSESLADRGAKRPAPALYLARSA